MKSKGFARNKLGKLIRALLLHSRLDPGRLLPEREEMESLSELGRVGELVEI